MNVFSFTPSRIGIISSRFTKSNASRFTLKDAGVSLESVVSGGAARVTEK
jgi:hypothetical protein